MGSLAIAGAVAGAGKGMVANAEHDQKLEDMKAANDYETQRQVALERMRNENANAIEDKRAGAQMGVAKLQQEWHTQDVATETKAKADEGEKQRTFLGGQGEANRQNRKDIATIRASATIAGKAGKPPKTWSFRNVTMGGGFDTDPKTGAMTPRAQKQFSVLQHRDGRQFVQVGDKFLPYDASKDAVPEGNSVRRAAASEVDKLVQNPDQADNFLATYHYLPLPWFQAAQKQTDAANARIPGFGPNAIPRGASVSAPAYLMGAGGSSSDDEAEDARNESEDNASTAGVPGNGYSE